MEIKILLIVQFFIHLINTFHLYYEEWNDGYFKDGEYWKPWHSSWKSWSNSEFWDSWTEYMVLNPLNNLWEAWAYGEYYDDTALIWRSWNGSWEKQWMHQKEWFQWLDGEHYDLNSLKCTPEWSPEFKLQESNQFTLPSFWRDLNFYVDPFSQEVVELGTLKYPYRSFEAAIIEIMHF